jgi:hypothetical protein
MQRYRLRAAAIACVLHSTCNLTLWCLHAGLAGKAYLTLMSDDHDCRPAIRSPTRWQHGSHLGLTCARHALLAQIALRETQSASSVLCARPSHSSRPLHCTTLLHNAVLTPACHGTSPTSHSPALPSDLRQPAASETQTPQGDVSGRACTGTIIPLRVRIWPW